MGAGISQKDLNRKIYTRLKKFQRQLARAGVQAKYYHQCLTGETPIGFFHLFYRSPLRASNGECAVAVVLTIGEERFGGWCTEKYQRFETGFERLLESGKRPAVPVDLIGLVPV